MTFHPFDEEVRFYRRWLAFVRSVPEPDLRQRFAARLAVCALRLGTMIEDRYGDLEPAACALTVVTIQAMEERVRP